MRENYYNNNRIYEFEAEIISIESDKNGNFNLQLNETYFYPEGGGQPADRGTIDGFNLLDVQKVDGRVIHTINGKPKNTKVYCILDKNHRDHYMIQHTGQHLISAVLKNELNIDTLSVHLGEQISRIEIDRSYIEPEELNRLEDVVNDLISSGKKIIYHETDDEGLKDFNIRRESKYSGYIRVVEIEGYDSVPCGGVHLSNLYEIGLIKVSGYEKIRGHIRITFLMGKIAFLDYRNKNNIITKLNRELSTTTDSLLDGLEILKKSITELKLEKKDLINAYSKSLVSSIKKDRPSVIEFTDIPIALSQKIAGDLTSQLDKPLLIINSSEKVNWYLLDTKDKIIDFPLFKKTILPIINGKGGGREALWQGSGECCNLEKFIHYYKEYIGEDNIIPLT